MLKKLSKKAREKLRIALHDIAYYREHILRRPLFWPQVEIFNTVKEAILDGNGRTITVMASRQTTKNEISGELQKWILLYFARKGGICIRTAPTYRPQVVLSKRRLEKTLNLDPFTRGSYQKSEGYIYRRGMAEIHFLSSGADANVVGSTADILLDIDEAHKVDEDKFYEDFDPMRASTNAPCVFWGVGADGSDLLWRQRMKNEEDAPQDNLYFPAPIWCEINPVYEKFFSGVVSRLGIKHPVVQTQYMLQPSVSSDAFFDQEQTDGILRSEHSRCRERVGNLPVYMCIDIAGEDLFGNEDAINQGIDPRKDSTAVIIYTVDGSNLYHGHPLVRILDIHHWVGRPLPAQQDELERIVTRWKPNKVRIDARGIGEQIGSYLRTKFGQAVDNYKATGTSVNKDCNGLYALVNNHRIKMFIGDSTPEYQAFVSHLKGAKKEVYSFDQIRMIKRSWDAHIDFAKCLSYIPGMVKTASVIDMRM